MLVTKRMSDYLSPYNIAGEYLKIKNLHTKKENQHTY